jgi:hypothetical protein
MASVAGMCVSLTMIVDGRILTVLLVTETIPDSRPQLAGFRKPRATGQKPQGDSHGNHQDDRQNPHATFRQSRKPDLYLSAACSRLCAVSPTRDFIGPRARCSGTHWRPPHKGEELTMKIHARANGVASSAQRENAYVSLEISKNQSKIA